MFFLQNRELTEPVFGLKLSDGASTLPAEALGSNPSSSLKPHTFPSTLPGHKIFHDSHRKEANAALSTPAKLQQGAEGTVWNIPFALAVATQTALTQQNPANTMKQF